MDTAGRGWAARIAVLLLIGVAFTNGPAVFANARLAAEVKAMSSERLDERDQRMDCDAAPEFERAAHTVSDWHWLHARCPSRRAATPAWDGDGTASAARSPVPGADEPERRATPPCTPASLQIFRC